MVANSGDSWVFAVEFSEPPRAFTIVAYSQSDVPEVALFRRSGAALFGQSLKAGRVYRRRNRAQLVKTYRPGEE